MPFKIVIYTVVLILLYSILKINFTLLLIGTKQAQWLPRGGGTLRSDKAAKSSVV